MKYNLLQILLFSIAILISCKGDKNVKVPKLSEEFIIDLNQDIIEKKSDWIDKKFNNLKKRAGFAGAILYTEKGQLVYQNGFGYGDIRDKEDITTQSSFQLASVSKMFTAMAVMILKERGLIDYEKDIRAYLPEFPYENITCRLLLTHRSGLPRYMSLAHDHWKDKRYPISNKKMLDLFIKHKPNTYFSPNNGFHYCNTNYALLANIIEKVSGLSFDVFIQHNIFDALGMEHSFVYTMPMDSMVSAYITKGVPGYRYRGWRPIRQRNEYLNGVMGDKGIYSSVEDMFKFDQALYHGTLVSDTILAEAFEKGGPDSRRRRDNYGFGWRIRNGMDSTVYHYGWWKGFRAFYIRDMKNEKSIIVLSNRAKGPGSYHLWDIIKKEKFDLPAVSWLADTIR